MTEQLTTYQNQLKKISQELSVSWLFSDIITHMMDKKGDKKELKKHYLSLENHPLLDTTFEEVYTIVSQAFNQKNIAHYAQELATITLNDAEPLASASDQIEAFLDVILDECHAELNSEFALRESLNEYGLSEETIDQLVSLLGIAGAMDELLEEGEESDETLILEAYQRMLHVAQGIYSR